MKNELRILVYFQQCKLCCSSVLGVLLLAACVSQKVLCFKDTKLIDIKTRTLSLYSIVMVGQVCVCLCVCGCLSVCVRQHRGPPSAPGMLLSLLVGNMRLVALF